MTKKKKKLSAAQKAEKKRRKELYMFVFINGKQVRVKRPPQIEGMSVEEFMARNADDVWYHQNEMWEMISSECEIGASGGETNTTSPKADDDECPFLLPRPWFCAVYN